MGEGRAPSRAEGEAWSRHALLLQLSLTLSISPSAKPPFSSAKVTEMACLHGRKSGGGGAGDSMVKGSQKETQDEDGELPFSFQLDYYCLGGSFPFQAGASLGLVLYSLRDPLSSPWGHPRPSAWRLYPGCSPLPCSSKHRLFSLPRSPPILSPGEAKA